MKNMYYTIRKWQNYMLNNMILKINGNIYMK